MSWQSDVHRSAVLSLALTVVLASTGLAATIRGKPLPAPARTVLEAILDSAGVDSVEVTSVQRDARQQSEVMFDYVQRNGLAKAYELYGEAGDRVLEVYEEHADKPRAEVVELMLSQMRAELVILEGQGNQRTQLMHVSDSHYVFDVAPSSIPSDKRAAFEAAVEAHPRVSRFLKPPRDQNAYHLEIPKQ